MKTQYLTLLLTSLFTLLIYSGCSSGRSTHVQKETLPKREFRGAWIQVVHQSRYQHMSPDEMKQYFVRLLDELKACNVNAIVFQVRPAADAFYASPIEPWSRYLTGKQGRAPEGQFDPMAFLIEECHKRAMEFHAWLNPYRVTASKFDELYDNHIYWQNTNRFVQYGNQIYFDPGYPENRAYICRVVKDIVSRYDVDAIHMDDYFYPYPIAGEQFNDDRSFGMYSAAQGFSPSQRADWRRNNVNLLIRELRQTIVATKPWVRFGISPFGIYRNKKSTPDGSGSNTNGLQNYDDLYADVQLWAEKGWIDYLIPQVYWEIGHTAADYETLVHWWANNHKGGHLYIGQDIVRTVKADDVRGRGGNQLDHKMTLQRSLPAIGGACWWPAYEIQDNAGGIADRLKQKEQVHPALVPAYTHLHDKAPKDVKKLKAEWTRDGYILHWVDDKNKNNPETASYYVIYRFGNKDKENFNDPSKIVAITGDPFYKLPYNKGKTKYKYAVRTVDRFHNESKKGKSVKVKL